MERTELSAHRLMEQAPATVEHYLYRIREIIDEEFGKGYAKEHPALVGVAILVCAVDYATGSLETVFQDRQRIAATNSNAIEVTLERVADKVEGITDAINDAAFMLNKQNGLEGKNNG